MFKWLLNIMVILVVTAMSANYFHDGGNGYGFDIHPYVYYGAWAFAAFMPVFWALAHVCGGILLGIASGGVLDGLRLGILLGLGMALSKLWPAAFGLALGAYLGDGLGMYVYLGAAAGVLLFALDKILQYFWQATSNS
ncbi:MAG: hypothetical protein EON60_01850 [Alphaproteobacteria bacterium]|nr:MAG: hypothetical protein EON60_01850 [Alphaproteobacteria bacterium]